MKKTPQIKLRLQQLVIESGNDDKIKGIGTFARELGFVNKDTAVTLWKGRNERIFLLTIPQIIMGLGLDPNEVRLTDLFEIELPKGYEPTKEVNRSIREDVNRLILESERATEKVKRARARKKEKEAKPRRKSVVS